MNLNQADAISRHARQKPVTRFHPLLCHCIDASDNSAGYLHMRQTHLHMRQRPKPGTASPCKQLMIHLRCWLPLYPCSCNKCQCEGSIQSILGKRRRARGQHVCAQQAEVCATAHGQRARCPSNAPHELMQNPIEQACSTLFNACQRGAANDETYVMSIMMGCNAK